MTPAPRFGWEAMEEDSGEGDFLGQPTERPDPVVATEFNDSLITNEDYGERE